MIRFSLMSKGFSIPYGFSLIEILLAVSLIALVTAVAVPNLRQYNKDREIADAKAQLVNILRTGQSSAISGIKCSSSNASTNKWQVDFTIGSGVDSYSLVANCQSAPLTQTVYTNTFSNGQAGATSFQATVDKCAANTNFSIFFTGRQVSYQCSGGLVTTGDIVITLTDQSGQSAQVTVEKGGVIR